MNLTELLEKVANEVLEVAGDEATVSIAAERRMSVAQKVGQQPGHVSTCRISRDAS